MDALTAVRLIALRDASQKPQPLDFFQRKVLRWAGAKYGCLPAEIAAKVPFIDILRDFYEAHYDEMSYEDLLAEIQAQIADDDTKKAAIDDAETEAFLRETEALAKGAAKPAPIKPPAPGEEAVRVTFADLEALDREMAKDPGFDV